MVPPSSDSLVAAVALRRSLAQVEQKLAERPRDPLVRLGLVQRRLELRAELAAVRQRAGPAALARWRTVARLSTGGGGGLEALERRLGVPGLDPLVRLGLLQRRLELRAAGELGAAGAEAELIGSVVALGGSWRWWRGLGAPARLLRAAGLAPPPRRRRRPSPKATSLTPVSVPAAPAASAAGTPRPARGPVGPGANGRQAGKQAGRGGGAVAVAAPGGRRRGGYFGLLVTAADEPLLSPEEVVVAFKAIVAGREARARLDTGASTEPGRDSAAVAAGAAARELVLRRNVRLAAQAARRAAGRVSHLGAEDLLQEAMVGLMRAVEKFDHRRGNRFSTYASWWIRQSVANAVHTGELSVRLPAARAAAARRRAYAGVAEADADVARARRPVMSLDAPVGETGLTLAEVVADPAADVEASGDLIDDARTAFALLGVLSILERDVIGARIGLHGPPASLAEAAAVGGVTKNTAHSVEQRALAKLRHPSVLAGRPEAAVWMAGAACEGEGPERYFVPRGRPTEPARRRCEGCPIREACAEAGRRELYGVWGATTGRSRRELRRTG